MNPDEYIFNQSSHIYTQAAVLLPRRSYDEVVRLYSFIRTARNYVHAAPQHRNEFRGLVATWQDCRSRSVADLAADKDDRLNLRVTKNIAWLMHAYQFDPNWIDAFLYSMELDLRQKSYYSLNDTLRYVYGSSEVIGFMVARIMGLPEEAMHAAAMQGRAMQWISFLRDIAEEEEAGQRYQPDRELADFGLPDLTEGSAKADPQAFKDFMHHQLTRCREWQREADKGMISIPKRSRLPVQAASESYRWIAWQIAKDPFVIYRHKLVPGKGRIVISALTHALD